MSNKTQKTHKIKLSRPSNPECTICYEQCNRSDRYPLTCQKCQHTSCRECLRAYILQSILDPCCPNCHLEFSKDQLSESLGKTWMFQVYRIHRQKVLFDRERSKVGEIMPYVEDYKQSIELRKEANQLYEEICKQREKVRDMEYTRDRMMGQVYHLNNRIQNRLSDRHQKSFWEFIQPCSYKGCQGFISKVGKCPTCEHWTCLKCFQLKNNKTDEDHVCNPDDVASAQLIRKSTRPCPECGTKITRISGCTQMWCTECHTSFSYRTGEVYKNPVHNPERDLWMQQGSTGPRRKRKSDQLEEQGGGGGGSKEHTSHTNNQPPPCPQNLPSWYDITAHIQPYRNDDQRRRLYNHYIGVQDLRTRYLQRLRNKIRDFQQNRLLKVQYRAGEINSETFKKKLEQLDRKAVHFTQILQIMELVGEVGAEIIHSLMNVNKQDDIEHRLRRFQRIMNYGTQRLQNIAKMNKLAVPQIHENIWVRTQY